MKKTYKGLYGLPYIEIKNVPVTKHAKHGLLLHADTLKEMEQMAVRAIVQKRLPIRGREVKFLRKVMGLSQAALADFYGKSGVMVTKWEKSPNKRLDRPNELYLRHIAASVFGFSLDMSLKLVDNFTAETPKLTLDFDRECSEPELDSEAIRA